MLISTRTQKQNTNPTQSSESVFSNSNFCNTGKTFEWDISHVTGQVLSQNVELALKPSKEAEVRLMSLPESRRWCLDSCILSSQDYSFLLLPDFLGLALSFFLLASGCSLPFIYLVPYALGNGLSQHHAAFLMSILGVIDIVGNITFGWLTDRKYESALFSFDCWHDEPSDN